MTVCPLFYKTILIKAIYADTFFGLIPTGIIVGKSIKCGRIFH
jgi:hypothetical protein